MRVSGPKLRYARDRRALALRDLAEQSGVSVVTIWRLENEVTGPARPSTIRKLANALGVLPEELGAWDEEEPEGTKPRQ